MGYRIRCFARRNRALVALTTALGVALVAGTVVAFTLAINANLARNRAQTEARVVSALNDFIRDDLLRQADPDDQPDRNLTLRAALDEAATRIALRFDERPEIAGRLHESVGQTYLGLGELDAAEYHLDLACALLGEHLGAEDPATLRARSSRGPLLHARGRFADGLAEMQAVSARQIAMLGREHRDVLVTRFHLGTMLIGLGRETEAVAVLKDVLDARRDRGEHETYKTLQVIRRLSNAERSLGLWADCEAHVREGLEICRSTLGEDHAAAAGFLESLGLVAREQGQYEEARTWIERAIAIHTTTRGPDHRRTLAAHTSLATVLRRLGSIDEAARLDEAVLEARTRTLGAEHPKTLVSLNAVALNAMERGDLDHAATLLEDALERHRRVLGDEHRDTLATLFNLALVRTRQESWEAAAELFAEAVRLARLQHPADHWRIGHFMLGHGRALAGLMRYDEAEPLLHEAHRILNGALGDRHRRTCKAAEFIADLYEQTGDAERAARWTERATASPTP